MMINQSSEEIQLSDGSQLKQMKSMNIRFGLANNDHRLYQGYMDDITLEI